MRKDKTLTYEMILAELMQSVDGPVPTSVLAEMMQKAIRSTARNPNKAMRQHIRQAEGEHLVFLDAQTVLPIRLAFAGARFRIVLSAEIIQTGLLPLDRHFPSFTPRGFPLEKLRFIGVGGKPLPTRPHTILQTIRHLFGTLQQPLSYADLSNWFRAQKAAEQDHLLVNVRDWQQGVFMLEIERRNHVDIDRLTARSRMLANRFFDLLEGAQDEKIYISRAVPTVYARLPEKDGYPPLHWLDALLVDGRMAANDWLIQYNDYPDQQDLLEEAESPAPAVKPDEAGQVYRLRAELMYSPTIWREIEIQGKQTLAELDRALRNAFDLDTFDHLSGFWRLVPRSARAKTTARQSSGKQLRVREVELGGVEPGGGSGEAAQLTIASLDLTVGDQLKYVYDFADWIEHRLTVQAINQPESGADYPREVQRNTPEYFDCVTCQKKGRQRAAHWQCIDCSTETGQLVYLCRQCARRHHEHLLTEILY